jgi:hypothetical protein
VAAASDDVIAFAATSYETALATSALLVRHLAASAAVTADEIRARMDSTTAGEGE